MFNAYNAKLREPLEWSKHQKHQIVSCNPALGTKPAGRPWASHSPSALGRRRQWQTTSETLPNFKEQNKNKNAKLENPLSIVIKDPGLETRRPFGQVLLKRKA